ncbi:hypothetical protein SKAU_G00008290 [Synaphobranchus kaupii]|uniref:Uncharacterized protein n=1 Tax=Synaphobranchus kaupii TaxID=118154 RepID=A0A9Q1JAY4_SYNKA|nr:hypothetical protein SKAU_G00008290 [Synaphobranchus kaupii]
MTVDLCTCVLRREEESRTKARVREQWQGRTAGTERDSQSARHNGRPARGNPSATQEEDSLGRENNGGPPALAVLNLTPPLGTKHTHGQRTASPAGRRGGGGGPHRSRSAPSAMATAVRSGETGTRRHVSSHF